METDQELHARVLGQTVAEYSAAFDILTMERHKKGIEEYGKFTFVGNDVVRMMMEELADVSNYCRMQFIKLMMLQHAIEEEMSDYKDIGKDAFVGTKDVGWTKP